MTHKGRIDLVTETDVAVENYLKENLKDLVPGVQFLAEESADGQTRPHDDCWIIDPVDGTTNFVHGIPLVGTSVGLWRDGRMELGVVNMPIMQECFYAQRGAGAWSATGQRLSVSPVHTLHEAVVATGFPYDIPCWQGRILEWLGAVLPSAQGVRRMGAASVDLAYVAAGRFEAFYEADLKPWDVAAGWLLVEEAGGLVSGVDGVPYQWGEVIVASNGHVHQALRELLVSGHK